MKHLPFPNEPGIVTGIEDNPDLFIRTVIFDVGYSEDTFHIHTNSFEFYIVMRGSLTFESGNHEQIIADANSVVYFEANEPHRIVEVSDKTEMLLLKKTGADKSVVSI